MKLRAIANDNIIERDGEEAEILLASGIYVRVDEDTATSPPPAKNVGAPHNRRAQYKRRDMQAD